ncbi:MAG: hypothetical protein ACYCQJ_10845 [Nitrososphaerales archaeon]
MTCVLIAGKANVRMAKAISYLREAIKLRETYGAHMLLSRYLAEISRFGEAEAEYAIATRINEERLKHSPAQ